MKSGVTIKQEQIIEAAIRRFAHFGIKKTTVSEIADDLGITRQSLFYYYTDKGMLVREVLRKMINELLDSIEHAFAGEQSVEEGLLAMIEVKRSFFKKYHLMAIQDERDEIFRLTPGMPELYRDAKSRHLEILKSFMLKGINDRELKTIDPQHTSVLLTETFTAFEQCMADKIKIPDDSQLDSLFDKEKEVLKLFLTGLKTNHGAINPN